MPQHNIPMVLGLHREFADSTVVHAVVGDRAVYVWFSRDALGIFEVPVAFIACHFMILCPRAKCKLSMTRA